MVTFSEVIARALVATNNEGENPAQHRLAKRLGCSQQAISSWVRGSTVPPKTRIAAFALVLGIDPLELAGICGSDRSRPRRQRMRMAAESARSLSAAVRP